MLSKVKAAFLEPMLLLKTERLPEAPDWPYEIKLDWSGGKAQLLIGLIEAGTATGDQWRALFPQPSGYFHFDLESGSYCVVSVPGLWRDTPRPN